MDWHTLAPKLTPDIVASARVEGDGNVGSVRELHFTKGTRIVLDFTSSTVTKGGAHMTYLMNMGFSQPCPSAA
jgi:hypothetical protein